MTSLTPTVSAAVATASLACRDSLTRPRSTALPSAHCTENSQPAKRSFALSCAATRKATSLSGSWAKMGGVPTASITAVVRTRDRMCHTSGENLFVLESATATATVVPVVFERIHHASAQDHKAEHAFEGRGDLVHDMVQREPGILGHVDAIARENLIIRGRCPEFGNTKPIHGQDLVGARSARRCWAGKPYM